MKDIVPAKHKELTKDQLKQLLNTLVKHDEHMETSTVEPINWTFVDLDQGLDDIPLDDYEDSSEVLHALNRIPEELVPLPDDAYDDLVSGLKATVMSHKLMVIYFEDDDYVEIDPETASELIDSGVENISKLNTKDEILDYISDILGV